MGAYDSIGLPVAGQPISSGNFGGKVRDAIIDLDRRVSSYDASTGVGKAFSTSNLVLSSASETVAVTITGQVFRAQLAYEATMRHPLSSGTATAMCNLRLRKTGLGGLDWGEFFRTQAGATNLVMSALGTIYLLNNTDNDITTDIVLTAQFSNWVTPQTLTLFATTASPRFLTLRPTGFAADFTGMGAVVS